MTGFATARAGRGRGVLVGPVGLVMRTRSVVAGVVVVLLLAVLLAVSVLTGDLDIPVGRALAALAGDGTRIENLVVVDHRLSRALAAVLVGFALGCAGALTQTITRNPIASPDIMGVSAGAGLFAVFLVTRPETAKAFGDHPAGQLLAPAAIVGGLLTTALILGLSWRAGFDGMRLILVGLGVNAIALAGVSFLLTRADLENAQAATRWLTGSLAGARMGDVLFLAPLALIGAAVCAILARDLAALRLGRDVAPTLGTPPGRTEAVALLVAVLLTSGAVAVAGPIAFVAFIAPQAALRAFGTAGPPPLAGGLVGALLVLAADLTAARLPTELPVGVPTAVIGAPSLLYLLNQYRRRTSA
ncbi:FecCD family ABC transporter permease [Actinomadura atramentaria]|uniref:FecCD family ABC transporter permease n=1 Tax=Actinomadura atramentaria TaxID=1990 RepID=UPI00036F687D|nr:iron ABC transporter permease [Actinomadura atramentaria]